MNCKNCKNLLNEDQDFCTNCGKSVLINKINKDERMDEVYYLNEKWWHRLSKVLIYGITLAVFIFSIFLSAEKFPISNNSGPEYVYSFEEPYSKTFGFSKKCKFLPKNSEESLSIDCGNIEKRFYEGKYYHLIDFLDRYSKSISYREEFLFKKNNRVVDPYCKEGSKGILFDFLCSPYSLEIDYQFLNEKIEKGYFDDILVKKIILLNPLLKSISLVILLPLISFVILRFVIYKTIIYIIFGNKKYEM